MMTIEENVSHHHSFLRSPPFTLTNHHPWQDEGGKAMEEKEKENKSSSLSHLL